MKTALAALFLAIPLLAQDTKFYRLDFVVKELDEAKVVSSKKYSTFISTDESSTQVRGASIRTGSKVPYQIGGPGPSTQYNYADVGVNIDCLKIRELSGHLMVHVIAEISSVPAPEGPVTMAPVVRQNRWTSVATIEPAKPTTLFSSDDLNSKRKLQLELTATPVK